MNTGEQFTFFWSGPFSQWHKCKFTVESKTYNCAEQYMMASKANLFKDNSALKQIMKSISPKEQKALGRKIKDFNEQKWNNQAKGLVYIGNHAKFTQNQYLLDQLLETKGTTLVEASPVDKIWGIGLAEDNPNALIRSNWLGKNWLGEVLTKLRDDLLIVG